MITDVISLKKWHGLRPEGRSLPTRRRGMCTPHRGSKPLPRALHVTPAGWDGAEATPPSTPGANPDIRDPLKLQIPAAGGGDYLWGRTFCLKPEKAVVTPDI